MWYGILSGCLLYFFGGSPPSNSNAINTRLLPEESALAIISPHRVEATNYTCTLYPKKRLNFRMADRERYSVTLEWSVSAVKNRKLCFNSCPTLCYSGFVCLTYQRLLGPTLPNSYGFWLLMHWLSPTNSRLFLSSKETRLGDRKYSPVEDLRNFRSGLYSTTLLLSLSAIVGIGSHINWNMQLIIDPFHPPTLYLVFPFCSVKHTLCCDSSRLP